jgi:hypothetical protein
VLCADGDSIRRSYDAKLIEAAREIDRMRQLHAEQLKSVPSLSLSLASLSIDVLRAHTDS